MFRKSDCYWHSLTKCSSLNYFSRNLLKNWYWNIHVSMHLWMLLGQLIGIYRDWLHCTQFLPIDLLRPRVYRFTRLAARRPFQLKQSACHKMSSVISRMDHIYSLDTWLLGQLTATKSSSLYCSCLWVYMLLSLCLLNFQHISDLLLLFYILLVCVFIFFPLLFWPRSSVILIKPFDGRFSHS